MKRKGPTPILRIGSGKWRGRKLLPPPGSGTRPMTGFAKKSLFSILTPRLRDAVVLDLYSGSGTLGLESLSRGARLCCFAERSRPVVARLTRNIELCGAEKGAIVWSGDLERKLKSWLAGFLKEGEKVDIAFVDPPFPAVRKWDWEKRIAKIFTPLAQSLTADGVVALRLPGSTEPPDFLGPLVKQQTRQYGDMTISFYGRSRQETLAGSR